MNNPNLYADDFDGFGRGFAVDAQLSERQSFIRKTYLHVFAGILAFIALETLYFKTAIGTKIAFAIGPNWWMAMIAFIFVSWIADRWAHSGASPLKQYFGLGLFIFAESIIFVPLLWMAQRTAPTAIPTAAFLTMAVFGSLTFLVFVTKQDFSFMRGALFAGSIAAMGVIVASMIFGFDLGILFAGAMVLLLCGYILYDTSNILHHYRTDQHVGAALALFGSIATLFWYMLRLVMILSDD
ncbi:MAG: Bax inhibitor-1 family protein [Planctomycetaceae bacterium]